MSSTGVAAQKLHEALSHLQRGQMAAAGEAAGGARDAFAAEGDDTGTAAALQVLAMSAAAGGDFIGAIAHVDAALPLRERTGDQEGIASLWQERFELCLKCGDMGGARTSMEAQYAAHEKAGDREGAAHAMHQLAQVLLQEGEVDAAEELVQQGIFRLEGPSGARGRAALHLLYANIWVVRNDGERAMRHAREALEIARGARFRPGEIDALQQIGSLHAAQSEWQAAQRALEEALSGRELLKDLDGRAHVLRELAGVELALGRVDEAVDRLAYAVKSVREAGNVMGEITLLQVLQSVADEHLRSDLALQAAHDLIAAAERTGDQEAVAASHFALASRLAGEGDLVASREEFTRTLALQTMLGLEHEAAVAQGMLGQVVAAMGDGAEGKRLITESLAVLDRVGSEAAEPLRAILAELDTEEA